MQKQASMTGHSGSSGSGSCLPANRIVHLDWNIAVDFGAQELRATATYAFERRAAKKSAGRTSLRGEEEKNQNQQQQLILDTNHLIIERVFSASDDGAALPYELLPPTPGKPHLGRKLVIQLGGGRGRRRPSSSSDNNNSAAAAADAGAGAAVSVTYRTTTQSSALQWLAPSQTAGKVRPYVFSQCQAIHARSLVPCQDVTGVKFTYAARVTVPAWATAVMSAVCQHVAFDGDRDGTANAPTKTAVWEQKVPVSSYLLALAAGELDRRELSDRCAVYSEPCVVDAAAHEFADTELFLQTAEQIAGTPYQWGRYDLLCLPPSFSYGGMENPNMTFVTPTLLAGDRSLANVVAHEIAHSWTGNYVTCASWDDFWLNEGWTVWLERKIASRLYGPELLDFGAIGGHASLVDAVKTMPEEFTSLVLPIKDLDPDDAYSVIAYEKGFNFLLYLERKVGTDKFEAFFQAYIKQFASRTLTSNDFRAYVVLYFSYDASARAEIKKVDWDCWYYAPGMPPEVVDYDRSLVEASENLAKLWMKVDQDGGMFPLVDVNSWSSQQITCFLDEMLTMTASGEPLKVSTLKAMNALYGFAASRNAEILLRYCRLAIAAEDESILPATIRFLTSQGRMKFIRPLYKALFHSQMGKGLAVETFLQNRDFYHPIGAKMVASDLLVSIDEPKSETSMETIRSYAKKENDDDDNKRRDKQQPMRIAVLVGAALFVVGIALFRRKR